jgi:hypothetical protein
MTIESKETLHLKQDLYGTWSKRNPRWEERFEALLLERFCNIRIGATSDTEAKGRVFGAGYEMFIVAFFIGLTLDMTRPLAAKTKDLGQPICFWGNVRAPRIQYPLLRKYMFALLIAKTKIDLLALDRGEIELKQVVDTLIHKMEEYANFGFHYLEDRLSEDPNCLFVQGAFFDCLYSLGNQDAPGDDVEPEPL